MQSATKSALEDLLREKRLADDAPPLRGEDRRRRPLPTGIASIDGLPHGGFRRGQLSGVFGPSSGGRTGRVRALLARSTQGGALAAFVDPADRLDPASAAAAGVDLRHLLWLRGPRPKVLADAVSAVGTLAVSGLFQGILLDLAGVPEVERRRLPGATWIRLQRMVEDASTALVLLADGHVAAGPGGLSPPLAATAPRSSGPPRPRRTLSRLCAPTAPG